MIPVASFKDRPVAVLGLGKSGIVAAEALTAGGARVCAWDDNAARRAAAADRGISVGALDDAGWAERRTLVLSPGIPHTHPAPHPIVEQAKAAGAAIIGDVELLIRERREARYLGVTGTNGKSTTTALLGHILAGAGECVEIGGNLGTPALALAPLGAEGSYVLEMSSYQLELAPSLACAVAVLLNITPDHLDRHGGMDGYIAAKRLIFRAQPSGATAVVGIDDPISAGIAADLVRAGRTRVVPISAERPTPGGVYAAGDSLIDDLGGRAAAVLDFASLPRLPGLHNRQNVAAAYAAARRAGVPSEAAAAAIATFPGLAHRQELVATIDGVRYVNDSKATNADAAAKALACYETVYWIAGGLAKEGGIASLRDYFPRIRRAFLIGEAAPLFADTLAGAVPHSRSGELAAALSAAHELARAERRTGAVVLLSPACASFDQFANFEERGQVFRRLVESLPGARS